MNDKSLKYFILYLPFKILILLWCSIAFPQTQSKTDELIAQAEKASNKKEFLEAAELYQKGAINEMQIDGFRLDLAIDLLDNASFLFFDTNYLEKAIDCKKASLYLEEKYYGIDGSKYTLGLAWLIHFYFLKKDYDAILKLSELALNLSDKHLSEYPEEYLNLWNHIGKTIQIKGDKQKALPILVKLTEEAPKRIKPNDILVAIYQNNLGQLYAELFSYDKAIEQFSQAINIAKIETYKNKNLLKLFINNIHSSFYMFDQYAIGLTYFQKLSEEFVKSNITYFEAEIFSAIGKMYHGLEKFDIAENYLLKAIKSYEQQNETNTDEYAKLLGDVAELYRQRGEFYIALEYGLKGTHKLKEILGEEALEYVIRLNNLSLIYQGLGDYDKAVLTINQVLPIMEKHYGINHPEYNMALGSLALLYQAMGQYDKAEILMQEILRLTLNAVGKNNQYYLIAVNNLANLYLYRNILNHAETYFLEALEISKKINGNQHSAYARQLSNLSVVYQKKGEFEKSLLMLEQAEDISKKTLGENHIDYAKYLHNLAISHLYLKQYKTAIELQERAIEIVIKNTSTLNPDLSYYYINLMQNYQLIKDFKNGHVTLEKFMEVIKKQIFTGFNLLSENEKQKFINTLQNNFYLAHSFLAEYTQSTGLQSNIVYDIELMTKSLILNASKDLRSLIINSENTEIHSLYSDWLNSQNFLAKQYALPNDKQVEDIYFHEIKSEKLEKRLIQFVKNNYTIASIGQINWQDIQKQLKDNEVAIEFSSYLQWKEDRWGNDIKYQATILRKQDKLPITIQLFTETELNHILQQSGGEKQIINQLYRGAIAKSTKQDFAKLYQLIWVPLETYIKQGQTIYYAPSGTLNQLAFAAIQNKDKAFISDIYDLKQVSSTAKILTKNTSDKVNDIHLFGGVDYNITSQPSKNNSWDYLEGTLQEVKNIDNLAKKANFITKLYTAKQATEEVFKSKTNLKNSNILHLATHGYFYPNNTKYTNSNNIENAFESSSNPLTRSGLLLAGANDYWGKSASDTSTEDGILTAYEVANMSLNNTKLVVLSACETGLGDIVGSEGVFGLQRAFKMAGVEYILMSLWKVPDQETKEFMTEFYNQYFTSQNIEKSFANTQQYMKNKYPNDLYSWAAFVLVR